MKSINYWKINKKHKKFMKRLKTLKYFIFIFYLSLILIVSNSNLLAQDITITVSGQGESDDNTLVVVYDQQDLEESQKKTLSEFLQSQSFLYIAKGVDDSEIGYLILRGFSTSRIAVFLDGIPISLAQVNALKLPLNLVKKIVIYKGNVSALFGPNAVGGAILIWTKGREQGQINFGNIYFSSLLNFSSFLHLSSFNDNLFSAFDLKAIINSNTYSQSFGKSDLTDVFAKINLEYEDITFSLFADYFKKYLPNDIKFPYFNTFRQSFFLISYFRYNNFLASIQYIDDYFSCHDYTYNIDEKRKLIYSFINYPFNIYKGSKTNILSNIALRFEYINDDTLIYKDIFGTILSSSFISNIEFDKNYKLSFSIAADFYTKYSDSFSFLFMPSIYVELAKSFSFDNNQTLIIFSKIGSGYRLPTYQELYSSYGIIAVGNPELKPEKSIGTEVGTSFSSNNFKINLSGYFYYFDDYIVWIRRYDNRFKPINFAKGYNLGFDCEIEYILPLKEEYYFQFLPMLSVTIPKILEGILILKEVYAPYIPLVNFIFDIDFVKVEKYRLRLEFVYRGIRYINIENYNWFTPYFLVNLDFTYYISPKSNLIFSIKNLLANTYYDLLYYPVSNIVFELEFSFYF